MDLRQVVERAGLLREGEEVDSPLVVDLDEPLFDVDVGRTVLAHGAELHEMAVGMGFLQREEDVQRSHDVVHLGEHRVLTIDHRIGCRTLFGVMDHGVGLEGGNRLGSRRVVGEIRDHDRDGLAGQLVPDRDALMERADVGQRLDAELVVPQPAGEVVEYPDVVPARGEMEHRWPSAVAIAAEYQYTSHRPSPSSPGQLLPELRPSNLPAPREMSGRPPPPVYGPRSRAPLHLVPPSFSGTGKGNPIRPEPPG